MRHCEELVFTCMKVWRFILGYGYTVIERQSSDSDPSSCALGSQSLYTENPLNPPPHQVDDRVGQELSGLE